MTDTDLHVLLAAAEPDDAQRVRLRLGLPEPAADVAVPSVWAATRWMHATAMPVSALLWMLECDRPEINEIVVSAPRIGPALRRDILRGLPFGDRAAGPLPVSARNLSDDVPLLRDADTAEVVEELRRVATMRRGRAAAALVQRGQWDAVDAADRQRPLPGYARWALAIRVDCPRDLRERLGAGHPSFAHRMRRAGIVAGPGEYLREWGPARKVLALLEGGRWAFPARRAEAVDELRPLVCDRLGGNPEAWAVTAQLLPTFAGTLPELIATAGAIA